MTDIFRLSRRRHSYLANRDEPPVIDRNRRKMMSRIVTALLVLSIMIGASGAAMAKGVRSPHINQVQRNQQHRIGQGVESGSLTPGETVRLERQEKFIRHGGGCSKSDGNFSRAERADVREDLRARRAGGSIA
jgi:hypothetical protein